MNQQTSRDHSRDRAHQNRQGAIGGGLSAPDSLRPDLCARALAAGGLEVRFFDKARGGGWTHGDPSSRGPAFRSRSPYFTVRDDGFARTVDSSCRQGIVAPWTGKISCPSTKALCPGEYPHPAVRRVSGMNAGCRHLARDLDVSYGTRI